MRSRPTHQILAFGLTIIVPWALIALAVATIWPEHLGIAVINGLAFISVVGVATINRQQHHRDVDTLRCEVDTAIKTSPVGRLLAQAGMPFRSACPDRPVRPVCVPDAGAVAGMEEGGVVDLDAVRDAIRHSHN